MGILSTLSMLWTAYKWLRAQKKELEANAEAFLTEERALEWRLETEKIFRALEKGNGNFERLPKVVKWFFAATKADNRLGQFGQWFLRSNRLATKDKSLDEPMKAYPVH